MTEHNHIGQYYSNIDWTHHQLMYTFVTRHRIVKAFNKLQPPFPHTGASSAIHRSLINPPTMFFFGGSSIQNQHNDLYRFTFDPNDSKPSLTAGIVNTRGQAPAPRSHAILSATDGHLFLWGGFLYVYAGHNVNRSVQGDMWRIELDSLPSVPFLGVNLVLQRSNLSSCSYKPLCGSFFKLLDHLRWNRRRQRFQRSVGVSLP
ncbi:Leucine-zipper-like transcriptional regulator 1 [Puccinia graminis f. sp. tritici]|uniref:Leucine-zipper-like transcriptional regulator 1 n=1 Tax=Puccinia graminis f. sp. tritici TaxID=56615 RepID=A0A5B0QDF3_PUCGR|nr:Leucine-zipper-like transcriptional regulator 1 [Puccinia graminis f. sp. tritici]